MSECYIFSGSEILNYSVIEISDDSYVICADAGYLHAKRLGIVPDCIIGDFDTFGEKSLKILR